MIPPNFPLSPVARLVAATAICGALAGAGSHAHAATAAGQQIKNLATVTYEDAAGNSYTADSNEAVVTVAQVYSATIGVDNDSPAAPGETIELAYELTNTGNGTDLFNVAAVDGATGSNLAAESVIVYRDTNGNGFPDAGEPALSATDEISIDAGQSVDIVVALRVPGTATAGQIAGVTLTARAKNGTPAFVAQSVDDLSPSNGRDATEGTVESRVTITNDAVLDLKKSSSHDAVNQEITYTLSVTNTGNTTAQDVVLFDGIPAGTEIARVGDVPSGAPRVSATGFLSGNGDTEVVYTDTLAESAGINFNLDGDVVDNTEASIGLDLNSDGDTADGAVAGLYARRDRLDGGQTITMTFTVTYDAAALGGGTGIDNAAHLVADTNNSGTLTPADTIDSSTKVNDTVAPAYGVDITDTDGAPVDSQRVASAASGGTVDFDVVVRNDGNSRDSFELTIDADASNTFPTGTIFSFYDSTGAVKLVDANGQGGIDTGELDAGVSRTIRVRAKLPLGISGNNGGNGFEANVRAVSAEDPSVVASADPASTPSIDLVELVLGNIVAASADIHAFTGGIDDSDENLLVVAPFTAVRTIEAGAGTSVDIPVFIDNESDLSDSYDLSVGSSIDGGVLGTLPDGWSVQFFLTDDPNGDGTGTLARTGGAVSSVTVPAGRLDFPVIARVTIPASAAQAAADVDYDIDEDAGTTNTLDQNGDGDGDYPLFLRILSSTSGATDTLLEAVDVTANRAIAFTPGTSNQIELGGSVSYPTTLGNDGNSAETLELTSAGTGAGFSHTVSIDTDGDGTPDTVLGNLLGAGPGYAPVPPITVRLTDGSTVDITVQNTDGDAFPELVVPAGVDLPFLVTVLAPSAASGSDEDTVTFLATNVDPAADAPDANVSFVTQIVNGNVRLVKTVAVDANCDADNLDAAAGAFNADSPFAAVQGIRVEPGECALWRIVATNDGSADALKTFVTDGVTPFSDFLPGSFRGCIGSGCTPVALPATTPDGTISIDAGTALPIIRFNLGDGASATDGGTLIPGQTATLQFGVTVR